MDAGVCSSGKHHDKVTDASTTMPGMLVRKTGGNRGKTGGETGDGKPGETGETGDGNRGKPGTDESVPHLCEPYHSLDHSAS
jgi:hypothetical protein